MPDKNISAEKEKQFSQNVIRVIAWGVLFGVLELIVSELLSTYRIPYRGLIITAYTVFVLVHAKFYNPQKFSLIFIVMIVVVMKGLFYQSVTHPALYAVFIDGVVAEVIFLIIGIKYSAFLITGFSLMLVTFLHGWIMHGIILGKQIFSLYKYIFIELLPFLNITNENITAIMIAAGIIHLILGILTGVLAWHSVKLIENVKKGF